MPAFKLHDWTLAMANRRAPTRPASLLLGATSGLHFYRRPPPSIVQFNGYVGLTATNVPTQREVQLRLRDGTLVDTTTSDPTTGYFQFNGWYGARDDYEYHVIGEDYVSRSFPVNAPAVVQWNGNPQTNPSTP